MVLAWRRAFCTSFPKDTDHQHCTSKVSSKFGFFSNPSTPRFRSQPAPTLPNSVPSSPKLSSASASAPNKTSPRLDLVHPKTPSTFSLLKSTLRLSTKASRCGVCIHPLKSGAVFTAECSHLFHLPCISNTRICPVCNAAWKFPIEKPDSDPDLKHVKTKSLRVYNDDEPLMSPTSAARFNPIPESNEEDEIDAPRDVHRPKSNTNVQVNLLPDVALLAVGRGSETCAVKMRVKAPAAGGGAQRPLIDLVTVVEVSGAMSGTKLETMKRAMRLLISSLSDSDRLSIVAFSATSKRLMPLRRMTATGRRSARRIVDALSSTGQGMCVSDAIKKAAKVLQDRRQNNSVASIVLFSDGRTDSVSSTRFSHVDIPVHAVTIGACDDAPSDATLAKCLGGLLSVVLQDLTLQLSGSGPAQVAAVYSLAGKPAALGSDLIRLGDFFAEEERELLVELKAPAGAHQILSVRSSFKDPSSGVLVHSKERALVVPRPQAVRSSSPSIKRLRNLHITVRAVAESRRLIEHHDLSGAHHLLTSARALLMKSSSGSTDEFLRGLEAEQSELNRRRLKSEPVTPTSAWRAAEKLAKVAIMRKAMNRVSDLHGFENAGF